MNNIVEQNHRNIKRLVKPMMGFQSFNTARQTLRGIEAVKMIRKGQVKGIATGDVRAQVEFVSQVFGRMASSSLGEATRLFCNSFCDRADSTTCLYRKALPEN